MTPHIMLKIEFVNYFIQKKPLKVAPFLSVEQQSPLAVEILVHCWNAKLLRRRWKKWDDH